MYWLCCLTTTIKEKARMKYVNANTLLPAVLVEELQGYIQGGYIYVPVRQDQPKHWGELSGYREELEKRNREIIRSFKAGDSMEYLAEKYYLSVYAIRNLVVTYNKISFTIIYGAARHEYDI